MSPVESDETDLTRKERREQARSQRKAMEEAAVASAMRRTRLTQLGIVVSVVVVAIIVILVATGGGSKKGIPTRHEQNSVVHEVTALVGGIPQKGNVLGSSTAPLTLEYFGDLECPICQKFTLSALPAVISKWVRTGKLKIEYRSLETATREPEVFKAQQVAAYAAGKQNKAWNFIETFYHEQGEEDSGYVTEKYIQNIASQVPGLNLATWTTDRGEQALANQVTVTDAQAASNNGFNGTPSFLIGHSGGALTKLDYNNPEEASFVNEAVEKLLKE
ncbi:MAG TPA: thioredoxin domain-containing protein [Solirubrobacteraceae bacterium]|jgi:protein-disulfide isomerase|nr:thioredoxin domain-containing protein [Solirubrobacteraceae bacterium]